jgi:predicted CXXCH cytochrome family protein
MIDSPNSGRANVKSFSKLTAETNYKSNCAPCHTSQLHLSDPSNRRVETIAFREGGINCEMCHGPSARHVADMLAGKSYIKSPEEPPVDFGKITSREYMSICAQCHMQSAIRLPQSNGEINYSSEGATFYAHYFSKNYTDFSRKCFYKDGRFRQTTFIIESFARTACFRKGQANCGNCHDPHPIDASTNPTSLKFLNQPDRMCIQCHDRYSRNVETHTHHRASSEGSRCVSCHMPRIMESLLFEARSHQIDDMPNAEMTLRFGREESPNACLLCHLKKDSTWMKAQLQSWKSNQRAAN